MENAKRMLEEKAKEIFKENLVNIEFVEFIDELYVTPIFNYNVWEEERTAGLNQLKLLPLPKDITVYFLFKYDDGSRR